MSRSYSTLILLPTFEERFDYLDLEGSVGLKTFGDNRYLNQALYTSLEWRKIRNEVIRRDNGCDLGVSGREILGRIMIHHLDPVTEDDILTRSSKLFSLDNLITVSFETHNALHYGNRNLLAPQMPNRVPGDTCPWKENRWSVQTTVS